MNNKTESKNFVKKFACLNLIDSLQHTTQKRN